MADIIKKINDEREKRGWSVYRLASEADLNQQTIHKWLNLGTQPNLQNIEQVCSAFGITLADFFAEGNMVELTSEKKALLDDWSALTDSEKVATRAFIDVIIKVKSDSVE